MRKLKLFLQSLSLENGSGIPRKNLGNGSVKFLTVFAAFFMLFTLGIGNVWGTDVTYTLTISGSDFNTTSYAANNNEKTSNAVCTTDNTKTYEVKWTSYQVMKNGDNMQWQKSKGYIYNSTNLGTIQFHCRFLYYVLWNF